MKFFFPQDDVQYDELIQRIKKEAGLTFFKYFFFLSHTYSLPVVPHKAVAEVSRIGNV